MNSVKIFPATLLAASLIISTAWSQTSLDIIDFLVDGQDHIGKTVTITNCRFGMATDSVVLCSAGSPGNVSIDSKSLQREDLRKALRECSGFTLTTPSACTGSVTGIVEKGLFGLKIMKAAIGWRPSS
jgi:hypothetical protein